MKARGLIITRIMLTPGQVLHLLAGVFIVTRHQVINRRNVKPMLNRANVKPNVKPDEKRNQQIYCNLLVFRRAENGIRTRDPQLGKLMLYQLSYFRN